MVDLKLEGVCLGLLNLLELVDSKRGGLDGVGKIKGASLITRLKDMANQGQPSDQADRNVQDDTHVMIGPSLSIVRRQPWMWKFSCSTQLSRSIYN